MDCAQIPPSAPGKISVLPSSICFLQPVEGHHPAYVQAVRFAEQSLDFKAKAHVPSGHGNAYLPRFNTQLRTAAVSSSCSLSTCGV